MEPDKRISLEDLTQLMSETGWGGRGEPKGTEFDISRRLRPYRVPSESFQEDNPSPQMGFLMWLLSQMRGGMWGQANRPDMIQEQWLQQQMQRPQMRRWNG